MTKILVYKNIMFAFAISIISVSLISAVTEDSSKRLQAERVQSVYFIPVGANPLLDEHDIASENLFVVTSTNQLKNIVAANSTVKLVYLHPDAIDMIEEKWLQKQYNDGLVIVALNTPISSLAGLLKLEDVAVDDLPMNELYGRIGVTALRSWNVTKTIEGYIYFSELLPDFHIASTIVNKYILKVNLLHVEQLQERKDTQNKLLMPNLTGSGNWWDCCGGRLNGVTAQSSYTDGGTRIYTGAGISTYSPAPSIADTIHVYLENSNDCGGWHTIFQGSFTASNTNQVWSGWQLVGSDQCPNPSNPNQVTGKIFGKTHFVQEYNPVSGSTIEWVTIPLN